MVPNIVMQYIAAKILRVEHTEDSQRALGRDQNMAAAKVLSSMRTTIVNATVVTQTIPVVHPISDIVR